MELLSERGRTDVGIDLLFKTDYPSWGYMAAQNATTIWEHWEYVIICIGRPISVAECLHVEKRLGST
jgi:hypothetical protein